MNNLATEETKQKFREVRSNLKMQDEYAKGTEYEQFMKESSKTLLSLIDLLK